MAFFGLTNLGYQDPIGDKLIVNPKKSSQGKLESAGTSQPSFSPRTKHILWLSDSSAYILKSGKK